MGGSNSVLAQEQFEAFANSLLAAPMRTRAEWAPLWEIENAPEELIWKLFSLNFLRKLKATIPFNMAALVCQCLSTIANCVFSPLQPVDTSAHGSLLLAVRILTRCLTVLVSAPDAFERLFMWSFRLPRLPGESRDDVQRSHRELVALYAGPGAKISQLVPGAQTVRLLTAALFLVGFTMGPSGLTGRVPFSTPAAGNAAVYASSRRAALAASSASDAVTAAVSAATVGAPAATTGAFPPLGGAAGPSLPSGRLAPLDSARGSGLFASEADVAVDSFAEAATDATFAAASGGELELYVHLGKVWFSGVGPRVLKSSARDAFDRNRVELLRCLLAACSAPVYRPSATYRTVPNPYLLELCAPAHAMAPTLFVSLLNAVLAYCPAGQVLSYLPYAHSVAGDQRGPLVTLALGLLLAALDFDPAQCAPVGSAGVAAALAAACAAAQASTTAALAAAADGTGPGASSNPAAITATTASGDELGREAALMLAVGGTNGMSSSTAGSLPPTLAAVVSAALTPALPPAPRAGAPVNVLRLMLAQFSVEDRRVTLLGLCELLGNPLEAATAWLPNSVKRVRCEQELLALLWHLLDLSPAIMRDATATLDAPRLARPLLFFLAEARADPAKVVVTYMCVFLLLRLCGERSFCVALNASYPHDLPLGPEMAALAGTSISYADTLIITMHALIAAAPNLLDSLLSVVLTVLANLSPFCMRIALPTALRLVELFETLAAPRFLLANSHNHAHLALLLEAFNNLLQYQYAGSTALVYAIARSPRTFFALRSPLQLPSQADLAAADASVAAAQSAPIAAEATPVAAAAAIITASIRAAKAAPAAPASGTAATALAATVAVTTRWRPTSEWACAWQSKLPLATTLRLIEFVQPRLLRLSHDAAGPVPVAAALAMLSECTAVGVLPVPHPIVVRRYVPNTFTSLWFSSFAWGLVLLRTARYPIIDAPLVKLFTLREGFAATAV